MNICTINSGGILGCAVHEHNVGLGVIDVSNYIVHVVIAKEAMLLMLCIKQSFIHLAHQVIELRGFICIIRHGQWRLDYAPIISLKILLNKGSWIATFH